MEKNSHILVQISLRKDFDTGEDLNFSFAVFEAYKNLKLKMESRTIFILLQEGPLQF